MGNEMWRGESPHLFREVLDIGDIVICVVRSLAQLPSPHKTDDAMNASMMYQVQCPRAPSNPERSRTRLHRPLEQSDCFNERGNGVQVEKETFYRRREHTLDHCPHDVLDGGNQRDDILSYLEK